MVALEALVELFELVVVELAWPIIVEVIFERVAIIVVSFGEPFRLHRNLHPPHLLLLLHHRNLLHLHRYLL